jgi:EAL domain-containing protein (putative c-di-GMP-specific phosphodiesterase class I)
VTSPAGDGLPAGREHGVALEGELQDALASGNGLAVVYRPVINVVTRRVLTLEAVPCWSPRGDGPVEAEALVDVARRAGVLPALELRSLAAGLAEVEARRLREPALFLAVDMSASTLEGEGFLERVRERLAQRHIPARAVVIEVTEETLGRTAAAKVLHELRREGFQVALDHYGRGATSLLPLMTGAADVVKIDRQLLRAAAHGDHGAETVLRLVARAGGELGITIICDGVDTGEDRSVARALGFQLVQGRLAG